MPITYCFCNCNNKTWLCMHHLVLHYLWIIQFGGITNSSVVIWVIGSQLERPDIKRLFCHVWWSIFVQHFVSCVVSSFWIHIFTRGWRVITPMDVMLSDRWSLFEYTLWNMTSLWHIGILTPDDSICKMQDSIELWTQRPQTVLLFILTILNHLVHIQNITPYFIYPFE
jgi:hypothetical protein